MGACFYDCEFPLILTRQELKTKFDELQEQDRYENGHCYSGSIGMAQGLTIMDRVFPSTQEALNFLDTNCQKWGPAIAVRGPTTWVVGAVCAS